MARLSTIVALAFLIFTPHSSLSAPLPLAASISSREFFVAKKSYFTTLKVNQPIEGFLKRQGISKEQIKDLSKHPMFPVDRMIYAGDRVLISWGTERGSFRFTLYEEHVDRALEVGHSRDRAFVINRPLVLELRTREAKGSIDGPVFLSLLKRIPSQQLANRFRDAFQLDYDLTKVPRHTPFTIVYTEKIENGELVKYGEILYASINVGGQAIERFFMNHRYGGSYVAINDSKARPLYSPVPYLRISSPFSTRRFHPIRRKNVAHLGIDVELPPGYPVYTAQTGSVVRMGQNRASGRHLVIRHSGGWETSYSHLDQFSPKLGIGRRVTAGEQIGTIGCTGHCTRSHLHFGVKRYGRHVDPMRMIKSFPAREKNQVEEFKQLLVASKRAKPAPQFMSEMAISGSFKRSTF